MRRFYNIVALFFALLITILQIGFGSCTFSDKPEKSSPVQKSIPVLTKQSLDVFTYADPKKSIQTFIQRFAKGLLKITAPDWLRTDLSPYFDLEEAGTAYLATVPLLPYKFEVPLIGFPFHYFW